MTPFIALVQSTGPYWACATSPQCSTFLGTLDISVELNLKKTETKNIENTKKDQETRKRCESANVNPEKGVG